MIILYSGVIAYDSPWKSRYSQSVDWLFFLFREKRCPWVLSYLYYL